MFGMRVTSDTPPALSSAAGDAPRPQGCTNFKLRQLLRRVSQRYDAEMAVAGLKTTQYSLLSQVLKLGPVRPGDLAQAMAMDASTLTRNLRPLITAGWVDLGAGADGRSRLVTLTAAGQAKRDQARACWRRAQEGMNALLGDQQVVALHSLIDDTLLALQPLEAEPASASGG